MYDVLQSVTVEVQDSFSQPLLDQFADTESSRRSKLTNGAVNPVVRVTSLKPSDNRTAPSLHASVHVGDADCSSLCALRFPKVHVGITSGDFR